MKQFFATALFVLVALTSTAAEPERSKWAAEMIEMKHQMIIEEVGLTPSQQDQFMPVYEEMEREIFQTNREARQLAAAVDKKKNPTDSEYFEAAEALSKAKVREGEIEAIYFDKFSKILSKKQIFLLKRTENKFTRSMLKKGKGDRSDKR